MAKDDTFEKALKAVEDAGKMREQAIADLLAQRDILVKDIDDKLARLGHQVEPSKPKRGTSRQVICKVCGEAGHNARRHAGEQPEKKGKKKLDA